MLFHNSVCEKEYNGEHIIYRAVLPYFSSLSLGEVATRYPDVQGDFETPQRAGTCAFRCLLTAFRYLMKRGGLRVEQRKQMTFALRLGFLDRVTLQLQGLAQTRSTVNLVTKQARDEGEGLGAGTEKILAKIEKVLNESDHSIILLALRQTARTAVKLQVSGILREELASILVG